MASLSLRHIYKIYSGNVKAVSDFNLEIDDKEFIVFVGPSGCGKSTTLRMIAGLEEISAGELYIDGKLVNDVEPKDRDIAMVFQNYALYPHMTVYENMAFGLRLRKMANQEIDDRVKEAAAILGITPLLSRKPKALSGGQRQRVALGRAIVREPKVFLLDEPLSNLDAKLRVQMRTEITKLHHKLATTFIYVTHDQTEAMTMGTRIVVMKDGIVQQVDTPQFLYDSPENKFVASFLGSPQMNFFEHAVLSREDGKMYVTFGDNKIEIPEDRARRLIDDSYLGKEITLGVRPEDIHDEEVFIANSPNTIINAHVDVMEKLGNETFLYMNVGGKEDYTVARIDARTKIQKGEDVKLAIDAHHLHFFDNKTELTIMGVPKYNMMDAKLIDVDGVLTVKFGDSIIALPEKVAARLTDRSVIGGAVKLGIKPESFKLERTSDAEAEIKAVVEFTEEFPRFTGVYSTVKGKSNYMAVKHPLDTVYKKKTKLVYFVDPSEIMLYNVETGEKLIAYHAITSNVATAKVTVKEDVAVVAIGKNKLCVPATPMLPEGTYNVAINHANMDCSVEAIKANPKQVLSGVVGDADVLGENTIVYAIVDGFPANNVLNQSSGKVEKSWNFTGIVAGTPKLNIGDKIKFVLNPENITAIEAISLEEETKTTEEAPSDNE